MRRPATLLGIVVAVAAFGSAVAAFGSASAAELRAGLRLTDRQPVVVRGTGFHAAERVQLTAVYSGRKASARALAGARGGFEVRFHTLSLARCGPPLIVTAAGSAGNKATLRTPAPVCPPD